MTTPRPPLLAYRPDLDGLRAVAVLAVVVFHFVPSAAPGGFVGVDVFFVLSGFLITKLTAGRIERGTFSFLDFYARRARRLLPALVLVVVACLVVGQQVYSPSEQAALGAASTAAALFGANLYFHQTTDYFTAPVETRPLLHLWSLGVEEQFYLLAPVVLVVLARWRRARLAVVAGAVGASLLACVVTTSTDPSAAFYLPWFRGWELGLGGLLALWSRSVPASVRTPLAGVGLLAVLVAIFGFSHATRFPGAAALLPTLGTLALLAAGAHTPIARALSVAPLRAIGRWSYAWYLWHWPVLTFATFWLLRAPTAIEATVLAAGSLAIAAASTRWLEDPLRHAAVDQPAAAVRVGLISLLAVALLGVSVHGAHISSIDGAPDPIVQSTLQQPTSRCDAGPHDGLQFSVCAFGDASGPLDVVLWGDSHAMVLSHEVESQVEALGLNGLAVARFDCLPVLGVDRADVYAEHRCGAHNDRVLAHLATRDVDTVLLHARWPLYASGSRYGDAGTVPEVVWAGSRSRPADLEQALENTVAQLQDIGARVVIIGSIPEVRFNPASVYARSQRLGIEAPPPPTRADFEARRAVAHAWLQTAGVPFLDPADHLCDTEVCPVHDGEAVLYRDDNHLDRPGSARALRDLATVLPTQTSDR